MRNKKHLILVILALMCIAHTEAEAKCHVSLSFFANFLQPPQPVMMAPAPVICQPMIYQQPMRQTPVVYQPVQYVLYAVPMAPCYAPCVRGYPVPYGGNPVRFAPY